jgi:hypothetical protein
MGNLTSAAAAATATGRVKDTLATAGQACCHLQVAIQPT